MSRQSTLLIKEEPQELQNLLKKQTTLSGEKRVKCLVYIQQGKFSTRIELAQYLGVHIRTMERWLKRYQAEGITAMLENKPKPKPSKSITPEIHAALEAKVNDAGRPFRGYWDAQQWLRIEYDVKINYHTLRHYLVKHFGTKLKTPRKSHIKKDKQATEAFLKTTKGIHAG